MIRLATLLAFITTLHAAEWLELRSGPFHVLSNASDREGRETLNFLEQLRYAIGVQLGQSDLQPAFPLRVVVVKKRSPEYPEPKLARDAFIMAIAEFNPQSKAAVAKLLLDASPGHIPAHIERGLVPLYSTLLVEGTRVTLGTPPAQKDRDWTRAHMLAVDPNYSGKLRVLLGNLGRGIETDVAYSNAFGMQADQIERAVDKYMEAGQYNTVSAPSRPINPNRDLRVRDADDLTGRLALADLLLANNRKEAKAAYEEIAKTNPTAPEAFEGLALHAINSKQQDEAREFLAKAGAGVRTLFELARLNKDPGTALKAAAANPRWAEPHKLIASLETHPAQKLQALRKAAQLEPRSAANWLELAVVQEANKQFVDAAKSWAAAERATIDPQAREQVRQTRLAGEEKRRQAEMQVREDARRKAEQEMNDLKNRALAEIRAAEARANAGKPVIDPSTLDEYKEGGMTTKLSGSLTRLDCMGAHARIHVVAGKQTTRLVVPDPGKVAIAGGGERSLVCGPQRPARSVTVEYLPKMEPKQGTAGDVVTIEFK